MSVVVGLVTYNSMPDLPDCIATVRAQTEPEMRLVVFDNASGDGSADWVERKVPGATLLRSGQNLGYGRAHNQILKRCDLRPRDYYLALNPDVRLDRAYVAELKKGLVAGGAGWGTGKLRLPHGSGESLPRLYSVGHGLRRDGYFFNIGYGLPDEGHFEEAREVFGAPGAAALYAQPLIDSVSDEDAFFDEDFFMYGEDTDIDWRARRKGWLCMYVPSATASHGGGLPTEALRIEAVANRYLGVLKNAPTRTLLAYNLPIIGLHVGFRLAMSPSEGFRLALRLAWKAPKMLARRRLGVLSSAEFDRWVAWSLDQLSSDPVSLVDRLRAWPTRRESPNPPSVS